MPQSVKDGLTIRDICLTGRSLLLIRTSRNVLSDYYVQNASFLRCDNITLGYTFKKLFKAIDGRVYGTVQNPFVITKYKGLDPEVANATDKTFGIDKNVYPRPLVGIIGLSLNF